MLADGLLSHFREAAQHLDDLDDEATRGVLGRLAGIALTGEPHPDTWLDHTLVAMSSEDRSAWAHEVTLLLDDRAPGEVTHQWNRWIRNYWDRRLHGVPRALAVDEASQMAEWPQRLGEHLPEAVSLATGARAAFLPHSRVLRRIVKDPPTSPAALGALVAHLLKATDPPFWPRHDLKAAYEKIAAGANEEDLLTIREQALRLGFNDAPDW
jgi:hypothetical protein